MEKADRREHYVVKIDSSIRTKDALFSRITDTAYLGYSSFSGWDAFEDKLLERLECSNILIEIVNEELSGLPEQDTQFYLEILRDALRQFPEKLRLL